MKVLSRYIAWQALKGIFVAMTIVTSIIMLVDFVEGSRNIGADADLNAGQVLTLTALKTPFLVEQTIPFIILFGIMGALFNMNRRSELIVMRASGQSAWKFLTPILVLVVLLGAMWTVLINPVAINALSKHDDVLARFEGKTSSKQDKPIWLREGTEYEQTVIFAPSYNLATRTLSKPEFTISTTEPEGGQSFSHRFDAQSAQLLQTGYWQLNDVLESQQDGTQQHNKNVSIPTILTPKDIQEAQSGFRFLPIWKLPNEINELTKAGFSNTEQRLRFHKLLSLPLTLLAMAVIAAGVSMRLTREGGTLRFMLTGAALGFAVFFVENMIKAFGETGSISVPIAVWLIPIFVLTSGLAYLSRLEDG